MGALVPWSAADIAAFSHQPLRAPHTLHESGPFGDDALVELLDRLPRSNLHAYTMGTDPATPSDWQEADHTGIDGATLMAAVRRGRLWLNILRVHQVDPALSELVAAAYAELQRQVPDFEVVSTSATLLVSSPTAQVYYHADGQPNLLWHVRGRKRVYVYPALDERFATTEALQRIFTGEAHEELPYDPSFDQSATVFELEPGHVASWPQNSPHRVENTEGLNVSLSTEHTTVATLRRQNVWSANRFFSTRLKVPVRGTKETGIGAQVKSTAYRALRKAGVRALPARDHTPTVRVDPDAELGYAALR